MTREPPAVALLSGGIDSTTAMALARRDGFAVHALTVDYGQRHAAELESARQVARALGAVRHLVVRCDLRPFGGSALTADIDVPKDRTPAEMAGGIPVTYVPARNTIFLAFALAWAETLGASDVVLGVTAQDYSGYPDCRPEYIAAFQAMADLATRAGVEGRQGLRIHTPLIRMTKADIIRTGAALGVDYALTLSCYDPASRRRLRAVRRLPPPAQGLRRGRPPGSRRLSRRAIARARATRSWESRRDPR